MQEELNQFERNKVWTLVPRPKNHPIIGAKWVFRNKMDEQGVITRNKTRLVAKGYNQEEGIDYDETYAPVARLEALRMLLTYASFMNFKLYQTDIKSTFLNVFLKRKFMLNNLRVLKVLIFQIASLNFWKLCMVWNKLQELGMKDWVIFSWRKVGKVDTTLFIKKAKNDLLIVQIYIDDIIFGATNHCLCEEFSKLMQGEFEMSMMGELKFLGFKSSNAKMGFSSIK